MNPVTLMDGPLTPLLRRPKLVFAARRAFYQIAVGVFVVKELIYLNRLKRFPGLSWSRKFDYVLLKLPESIEVSLAAAFLATIVLGLLVRHLTQPRLIRWLSPRGEGSFAVPYAFRLEATERAECEWPARQFDGSRWAAGILVLTNQALRFFPHAWDREPWETPRGEAAASISTVPAEPMSWGYVTGKPEELAVKSLFERYRFALLDPRSVVERLVGEAGADR